jgi:hypothetical protein
MDMRDVLNRKKKVINIASVIKDVRIEYKLITWSRYWYGQGQGYKKARALIRPGLPISPGLQCRHGSNKSGLQYWPGL